MNRTLLVCFFICLFAVSAFAAETKKDKKKKDKDPFVSQETLDDLTGAIDTGYILASAVLAFYVSAGYMMLEVGAVRVKNTKNVILKGTMNLCLATFCFWATGFAIGFGVPTDMDKDWEPNPFIGQNLFFLQGIKNTDRVDLFFFYLTFLAVVPCIVSGSLSERTNFSVYFAHTAVISLFSWPVLAHWIWGGGWLETFAQNGFLDYAGGGLVHVFGGTCALIGCVIAGPRLGRFIDGKPREIAGYSTTLVALGVFIQWFGWTGFVTGGSGGAVNNLAYVGGKAVANTAIAASFAGVICLIWSLIWLRDAHLIWILHAINCGLVSVSAGAGYFEPWVACIVGCGAPFVYRGGSWLLNFLRVDDPMDSVPVHLGGGLFGVIVTGCFATADYIGFIKQRDDVTEYGLFLGGGGEVIGTQFLGLAVIIGWAAVWSAAVFFPFKFLKMLRVDSDTEKKGIDVQGYGADSWGCVEIVDNGKIDEFQFRIQ